MTTNLDTSPPPPCRLDALADDANIRSIAALPHAPGAGFVDETIRHLNLAAIAALKVPEQVSRLFVDHLTLAVAAHVAQTYRGMDRIARLVKGGLALWQERRAKEMIAADLTGATPLAEIAAACGLSTGHFARAFRRSVGVAPHAWLLMARIERAKSLLCQPEVPLSEIALTCGFADQSHLTRTFIRHTGQSPGVWRRPMNRPSTGDKL